MTRATMNRCAADVANIAAEIEIDDVYRHVSLPDDQDLVGDSTRLR